ncbi:MAG: transcription antitermination factor NusB [Planctomycetes bacterium]|nr:transcription antitermination factor NusB [Planctomycetota bacterium]
MARSRDIRRCALQALYQFDAGSADTPEIVRDSLAQSAGDDDVHEKGFELAVRAWALHEEADAVVAKLAPDWPTYRQPVVDRNILRLAYFEITSSDTPPKVAINEAVELAKEFSTQKSPLFINGVLDKIYKSQREVDTAGRDTASGGAE